MSLYLPSKMVPARSFVWSDCKRLFSSYNRSPVIERVSQSLIEFYDRLPASTCDELVILAYQERHIGWAHARFFLLNADFVLAGGQAYQLFQALLNSEHLIAA